MHARSQQVLAGLSGLMNEEHEHSILFCSASPEPFNFSSHFRAPYPVLMCLVTLQKHATEVERYDPATDKWEEVCEQPISRAFMSAVVVDL